MASIREVAKLAGVSVGSVSRYLNGQQLKDGNMVKIAEAIQELDYKENIIAKGLKNNRSFSVGLLMNSISSRFGAEIVSSIEEIMEANGYSILLSGFNGNPSLVDKKIEYLMKHAIDGLIVFVADEEWAGMEKLADLTIPVLSINSPNRLENVDSILSNDRESVKKVIQHIASLGHEKIGVIAAPQTDYVAQERLQGVYEATEQLPNGTVEVKIGDYSRLSGYQCAEELIAKGITALFVSNFNMSIGAMELLNQKRIKISEDLLFSHYDYLDKNNLNSSSQIIIQQPTKEIGKVCAELLLERMNDTNESESQTIVLQNNIFGLDKKS